MKTVTIIILGLLLVLNLFSFFLMRHDKQCARKNQRRVPEKMLFLSAILFGGFGGTLDSRRSPEKVIPNPELAML